MPGNSPFRNSPRDAVTHTFRNVISLASMLLAVCCSLPLPAQVRTVDPGKTITFQVAGATAAYSLDSFFAEAMAENGLVSVEGKVAGTTHVVVVTPAGVQTFEILVNMLPPVYPAGYVPPVNGPENGQSGSYQGQYYSSSAEFQNQLDFLKTNGDNWTHVHLVETSLLGAVDLGQSRIALSSATYEIVTPGRDITLLDKYLDLSQLTINGSIVRGFHIIQGNWFVDAGYSSVATFDGLFLPLRPELVAGGGYRYPLTENSSLSGSFYQVAVPASDAQGHSGSIGDMRYEYDPMENFWFNADVGISHGIGAAGRLHYITGRDKILGSARYMPLGFASLGANNLRGLHTDLSWTREVTKKFETDLAFYHDNLLLPGIKETTTSGSANLRYQLTRHWAINGGGLVSIFDSVAPSSPPIRNITLPAGLAFQSNHFDAAGQYQFSVTPGSDAGATQFRASVQSGWGAFNISAFAERDANAPTLSFIFGQLTGLQQILEQQGIQATSVQQVDALLSTDSYLIAAGYIKGVSINVVPLRTQAGGTADWSTRGVHRRELTYSFLYNDDQALRGSTEDTIHTLSFIQHISQADNISLSCSLLGLKNPGSSVQYSPACFVAYRRQFEHVPEFIIPERRGTITGNVFQDDQSRGKFEPGMPPLSEVEVMLDGVRHTLTGADGAYEFPHVHRGKHKIEAVYASKEPFFFTTPSELEVSENAIANFGIGHSLSGLSGKVLNDAGQGVAGVAVTIENGGKKWSATTEADGSFFVSSLVAGDYNVHPDADSLPAGYSTEGAGAVQRVTVGAASPGKASFTERALRSIAGRVMRFDTKQGRYVPMSGAPVILSKPGLTARTDVLGRYLFRGLAAGSYTISVQGQAAGSARAVRLGGPPVDLANVDFQIGRSDAAAGLAPPTMPPEKPQPVVAAASAPKIPASISAAAQEHNVRGRELTEAARYREALAELTEALRISPDFELALNARGYVLLRLHEGARAIEDLDKAISLDPKYANAYRVRAAARRSLGDLAGAAADLKKEQHLAH